MPSFKDMLAPMLETAEILDEYVKTSKESTQDAKTHQTPTNWNDAPPAINEARLHFIQDAKRLLCVAKGPEMTAREYLEYPMQKIACMRVLIDFGVFDAIRKAPAGMVEINELASVCNMNNQANQLARIIERVKHDGILTTPKAGYVSLTELSQAYASGGVFHSEAKWFVNPVLDSAVTFSRALRELGDDEPNRSNSAFNRAYETDLPIMEWVNRNPAWSKIFSDLMQSYSKDPRFSIEHVSSAYEWSSVGRGHVVDVGGNAGLVSLAIATRFPQLYFTVQDQEDFSTQDSRIATLGSRVVFQQHDFFQPNPVSEPEIFFMRWILHDWPDSEARRIISSLTCQMGSKTRLLIMDGIAQQQDSSSEEGEALADLDIIMMTTFNGRERTLDQWLTLFREADPSLKMVGVHRPEGSALSLMVLEKSA